MHLEALAKINLFLEILGKRSDGYHDLRTLIMPISLADEIQIDVLGDSRIETEMAMEEIPDVVGVPIASASENLATRAARLLQDATGCRKGARIRIRKRIPLGGGLGGGSSDAAAVLRALNRLWGTGLEVRHLVELGAQLGSDVPALVQGGAVIAEGRGERVRAVAEEEGSLRARWWGVVAHPGFGISTADIYARYCPPLTDGLRFYNNLQLALTTGDVHLAGRSLYNGLEETVFRKYPLLRLISEGFRAEGALGVLLSGSGSSVFALAENEGQAWRLQRRLEERVEAACWSRIVQTLPDGVMAAHDPLEVRV